MFVDALDLEAAVNARKDAYLEALAISDRQKDAGPFVLYMLNVLKEELEKTLKKRPQAPKAAVSKAAAASKRLPESVERLLGAFDGKTLTGAALDQAVAVEA